MIIDCVGCLHGARPNLEGGDLLIITGDLTARDTEFEHALFDEWLDEQKYKKKIVIAGNHDNYIQEKGYWIYYDDSKPSKYLEDSGTEFEGLKIWGSPWTNQFPGINPKCCAFTRPFMESLDDRWNMIPDVDILVTHGPPFGVLDQVSTEFNASVGSMGLLKAVKERKLKLHVFSHIHDQGGKTMKIGDTTFINCSIMDERYRPVHAPTRVEL